MGICPKKSWIGREADPPILTYATRQSSLVQGEGFTRTENRRHIASKEIVIKIAAMQLAVRGDHRAKGERSGTENYRQFYAIAAVCVPHSHSIVS